MRRKVIVCVTSCFVFAAAVLLASGAKAPTCSPYADPVYQGNANKGGGAQASIYTPYADPFHQGNAEKGGGEGRGEIIKIDENRMDYEAIDEAVNAFGVKGETVK